MGLHVTPYGTFYVQRSLQTGEVMQVLPVKRPEKPSHLPSVDSLGITENFIERRRASLAADTARVAGSQDRLQQELETAGGESLLATGKAVLAQRDDEDTGSSTYGSQSHSSSSSQHHHGDPESSTRSRSSHSSHHHSHHHSHSKKSGHRGHKSSSSSSKHKSAGEETYQSSSTMAEMPHYLPVRPWPEALQQETTVTLPPFRQIDSATALSQEEALRQDEQAGSKRRATKEGGQHRSTASPRADSQLLRGYSRSSASRSNSLCSMGSYDSEGRSGAYSASETFTSATISTTPDNSYYSPAAAAAVSPIATPALPRIAGFPAAGVVGGGGGLLVEQGSHLPSPSDYYARQQPHSAPSSIPPPLPATASPSGLGPSQPQQKKTVWVIRTLEPRKLSARPIASGDQGSDEYEYEPQGVQTRVETHILS